MDDNLENMVKEKPNSSRNIKKQVVLNLMKDEKILLTSDSSELVITTHRIRFETSGFGFKELISFLLVELDSCAIIYRSFPLLLILTSLFLVAGLAVGTQRHAEEVVGILIGLAVLFGFAYVLTRKAVLRISSKSSQIHLIIRTQSMEKIKKLIDTIESAKNNIHSNTDEVL